MVKAPTVHSPYLNTLLVDTKPLALQQQSLYARSADTVERCCSSVFII